MTLILKPSEGRAAVNIKELWDYRNLLYFMVWRDLKVRYKQTFLGASWAIIQPVFSMIVFSIFFGHLAKMPSDGVPYPVFSYTALLPWQLFANSLAECSASLVANRNLITKVYFPRLIIPMASIFSALVDFGIAFLVLLVLMAYFRIWPGIQILALPFFVLLAVLTAFSVGLWLSALNAQYRDFRYTLPFLIQLWLFASPVVYPSSMVPAQWRTLYGLNPMVGVVEGFRWCLLGIAEPPGLLLAVSVGAVAFLLVSGLLYFRKVESTIADSI
ncbi:MAG: ABC transporter permease [Candidatus Obscuribacterales bacterium]|nr:ABC transporter permease [Candidatus Obscuribacterales bacterium]